METALQGNGDQSLSERKEAVGIIYNGTFSLSRADRHGFRNSIPGWSTSSIGQKSTGDISTYPRTAFYLWYQSGEHRFTVWPGQRPGTGEACRTIQRDMA